MKKEVFDRFEFDFSNSLHEHFKQIELIPQITLFIDSQMEEGLEFDTEVYLGYKQYSVSLSWLIWFVSFGVNFKTGKWQK